MKKVAYLLTMVFVLTFAFTSCEKDDSDEQIIPQNPNAVYLGVWETQTTYEDDVLIDNDANYSTFEFVSGGGAIIGGDREYTTWSISGSNLTLSGGGHQTETLTIVIAPTISTPNDMTLKWTISGKVYKFILEKI